MDLRLSGILMGSQTLSLSLSLSLYSLRVVCAAALIGLLILVIIKRAGQGRGTEKINLIDPWLRKFPFEAPQSRTSMQGGAILIPGFCSPKALKPLLPVFLSELEDLADGFAAVERVAIDARPCMANQVHHLRLALTQDALCMDKNNMTAEVRFVFVEFDVNFASLVEGLAVADIVTGEGNTTTWKMCKKAELCQPKNKLIKFRSN